MLNRILCLYILIFAARISQAQCPQIYDYLGNLSNNPYFINCQGTGTYNMNVASNTSWGAYSINWGDGTPNTNGGSYTANSLINHIYNSATPDTFVITLTIPSLNCTLTGVAVMEKPVNASIQIPIGGVTTACAPKILQFTNSSTDVSETTWFTWNFGDGSALETYSFTNAGQTISHQYNQGTVNCQTAVTLTAKNYCTPVPTIANFNPIQIYDIDDAAISPSAIIKCWPDNVFTYTNTTNRNCVPQGNTFQRQERWNLGDYWGLGHDSIINWRPWPPTSPLTVAYPSVGTYTVQLQDSNLCGVDVQVQSVTIVNPPTAGVIAPPGPFCAGSAVTFTNTSSIGFLYKWNFGTGGGFVSRPFGPQTFTYNTAGTYTVKVVALIGGGGASCTDTSQVVISILPRPTANFTVSPNKGCNSLNGVVFSDLSTSAISWDWDFGNGNTFSGQIPPSQNYSGVNNYVATLTVTAANTCVHSFTAPINVYQIPTAAFTTTNACMNSPANFTDVSTHASGDPIISWNWNFGDASPTATTTIQNPAHTYTVQNTYTVQLIVNTANCADTIEQPITINIKPIANFSLTPTNGCPTLSVNFSDMSSSATLYNWSFGNSLTSTLTNPSTTYTNSTGSNVVYTVSLVASTAAGCSDTHTETVIVFPTPISSFTVNAPAGCSPIAATFTNNSTGATSFNWDFGDTSTSTSTTSVLSHTYVNSTLLIQTYTIQLVAISNNGCKDTSYLTVTAYPRPIFNFTMVPNSGCSPLSINFPPVLGAVTYQWDFGDGSPLDFSPNPTHVFTNTTSVNQTYTVQLIASNAFSCVDTTYGFPVVFAQPKANFAVTPTVGCSPLSSNFTNSSISATSYLWKFGDGNTSTSINASHSYFNSSSTSDQTFTCTLVATSSNGCKDSLDKTVLVYFKPNATFTPDTPKCASKTISFTNNSLGIINSVWDFGDFSATSALPNPTHTYTNNTSSNLTFSVQLIVTTANGCKDTTIGTTEIYARPIANFSLSSNASCSPLNTSMTNSSLFATSYLWKFGDGSTDNTFNTSHSYTNTSSTTNQTVSCQLIAINSNGCVDSTLQILTIYNNPKSDFTVDTPACSPKTLNFTNTSIGAISFQWDLGVTTSTNINISAPFVNATTSNITQTVQLISISANNCKDTLIVPIIIHPKPDFNIIASPDSGCSALTVNFPIINDVANYQWNFGDGNISNSNNASNTFYNNSPVTKTFTVQLIGTDGYGCKDTSTKVISVFAKPIALFQANPTLVYVPTNPVTFSNLSSGAVNYFWNFGDGNSSTETNPIYTYQDPGEYQVYLVAENTHGCRDTFDLPNKIIAEIESSIDIPNAFSPNPNGGNGGAYDVKDLNNDVFHPVIKGIDKYELNIFSRWGELLFVSKDINIGWDGYYKGKLCTQDVYVWKINATTVDGKKINKTGDVLLLR
jgi:gliding motility-associated-like protein